MGNLVDVKLQSLSPSEAAYLLAAVFVPIIMLWIYLRISVKNEEKQKRADANYKEMIRASHLQQSLRFEPTQSDLFSGMNGDTYTLNLKNIGEEITNLSFSASQKSNVKKIYTSSAIETVKQGEAISLILHLQKGNNQKTIVHENLLPDNTIFSIKYDTAMEEGVVETYQLAIEYHPQNSIVRIVKR